MRMHPTTNDHHPMFFRYLYMSWCHPIQSRCLSRVTLTSFGYTSRAIMGSSDSECLNDHLFYSHSLLLTYCPCLFCSPMSCNASLLHLWCSCHATAYTSCRFGCCMWLALFGIFLCYSHGVPRCLWCTWPSAAARVNDRLADWPQLFFILSTMYREKKI